MSSIDTGATFIGTILRDGKPYVVPKFQRDYSWTVEEVDQLWDDVFRAIEEKQGTYFIGSMVINDSNSSSYDVIDGQQRLSTISILICALRDVARSKGNTQLADRLASDFLGKFEYSTGETNPKLTLNVVNKKFYSERIINNPNSDYLKAFVKNTKNVKSNRLLASAYLLYCEKITEELDGGALLSDFIDKVVKAIDDVIQVIRITVKDDYDAYMLFETLNDRGLALSVADLLKNYLFSKADESIDDVQENWQEMIDNLGRTESKRYLRHLWLSKFGVVRDKDLYSKIKGKYASKASVVAFSRELRDSSDSYAALSDPQSALWTAFSGPDQEKIRDHLEDLILFGVNQYNPLLLSCLEANPSIFPSVLRLVKVFAFRYSMIMGSGTGNIERNFSEAAVFVRNNKDCSAKDVFEKVKHLYPDDDDFADAFAEKSITTSSLARYILRSINDRMEAQSGLVVNKNAFSMNLEHVLPQKFDKNEWKGFSADVDPSHFVHRLGNMTILSAGINRKVSNADFATKLAEYKKSTGLKISDDVFSEKEWTEAKVLDRQKRMAKIANEVWRVDY